MKRQCSVSNLALTDADSLRGDSQAVVWSRMGIMADSSGQIGWPTAIVGAALAMLLAALFIGIGIKQRRGTLKPNQLVGYRTRTIMANDATWYAAHSASAGYTIAAGAVVGLAGLVLLANPASRVATASIGIASVAAFALIMVGAIVSQRAAKLVDE